MKFCGHEKLARNPGQLVAVEVEQPLSAILGEHATAEERSRAALELDRARGRRHAEEVTAALGAAATWKDHADVALPDAVRLGLDLVVRRRPPGGVPGAAGAGVAADRTGARDRRADRQGTRSRPG
ncbi:MAG TPA: hypothetical protein VGL02_22190 [Streptomyces sp.]